MSPRISKTPNEVGGLKAVSQRPKISQLRKKQAETADEVVGRLASEAAKEIERLRESKGFADQETRKIVWHVINLFRDILRAESEKRGQVKDTDGIIVYGSFLCFQENFAGI